MLYQFKHIFFVIGIFIFLPLSDEIIHQEKVPLETQEDEAENQSRRDAYDAAGSSESELDYQV